MPIVNDGNNGMYMPVAPINYGGMGGGMGGWSDGWWIILLLLCGWGGMGGMGGFGGMMGGLGLGIDFPWLLTGQNQINANTNSGFDHLATQNALSDIRTAMGAGFGDVNLGIAGLGRQICETGGNIVGAINGGFSNAEIAANSRAMSNMQQLFNVTTGIGDLKYTVAQENCLDRQAVNEGVRDILANQTAGVQRILDKLCDQELQAERRENANLRNELQYARNQASQVEQTARILAGQTAEVDALYNRLASCPVGTTPVYGNTPIFTCPQRADNYNGCGCGYAA